MAEEGKMVNQFKQDWVITLKLKSGFLLNSVSQSEVILDSLLQAWLQTSNNIERPVTGEMN